MTRQSIGRLKINKIMKKTTLFLILITMLLASCSAVMTDQMPNANYDKSENYFLGKWISLQTAKDSLQTHVEFFDQGIGNEFITKGDSVMRTYPFRYSFNSESVTFESTYASLVGVHFYRFVDDTLFLGDTKYLRW